ncbi:hypothetical protein EYF80_066299 [Liparis tanakae]|uniref:Uncharacterized protein n=1 Tax=Liparis tanakae TaxID=230148 RepID=A0A4Z2E489_9TELE|nr:hypothetical protein EYF80_066299 [Liparis tanakae]
MEMRLRKRRRAAAPPLERHKRSFMQMSSSCTLFQPAGQRRLHLWRLQGYRWSHAHQRLSDMLSNTQVVDEQLFTI